MFKSDGSKAPSNQEWQMGKTVGSIDFIIRAQEKLETEENPQEIARLRAELESVMKGEKILTSDEEIDNLLEG